MGRISAFVHGYFGLSVDQFGVQIMNDQIMNARITLYIGGEDF